MKAKHRTEVTMKTLETTVIRFGRNQAITFCAKCQANTRYFSIAQAVSIFGLSEQAIIRLADENEIHSTQSAGETLLLCGQSLATQAKE